MGHPKLLQAGLEESKDNAEAPESSTMRDRPCRPPNNPQSPT